jgi:uncharacterized membrane protein
MHKVYHFHLFGSRVFHGMFMLAGYNDRMNERSTGMKKVWKWVIGIIVALLVIGLVVAAAVWVVPHLKLAHAARFANPGGQYQGPRFGEGYGPRGFPGNGQGMMPFGRQGWGMHRPGMMGYGMMFPFGMLFSGLFGLGVLALAVMGVLWLVGRLSQPKTVPVAAAPAPMRTCSKCGHPVQEDWKNCPYCGKKL